MADVAWLIRRLKAMSIPEVIWRVQQKLLQKYEARCFREKIAVCDCVLEQSLGNLKFDIDNFILNWNNETFNNATEIELLGGYSYSEYKKSWNAGFQTNNKWPNIFSYALEYKQRDDIGDARTNWELNRHFQFALLAKAYYVTNDKKYLHELRDLFDDYNINNPFLYGISWTSAMEFAIRAINWMFALAFLKKKQVEDLLCQRLSNGIINMVDYLTKHYSRYSSANNHLIVEMAAIGIAGIAFNNKEWEKLALKILTEEFPNQNYSDGVNKELSLHYQSFYMEAVGLFAALMINKDEQLPLEWTEWLTKMTHYLRDCVGKYGEVVVFGDDDEGKVIDLVGIQRNITHYEYVLQLMSCILPKRYIDLENKIDENINWIFNKEWVLKSQLKELYFPNKSICYKEGGNTILHSDDGRVTIGIDHAALGFGSIAAHGHADALSFQMYVDGKPIFVDPGTYIYHCDLNSRNEFRKTCNHNTICVNGEDQSEMLGAFLWGKRAECKLLKFNDNIDAIEIEASHNGYINEIKRNILFCENRKITITDTVCGNRAVGTYILHPDCNFRLDNNLLVININNIRLRIEFCSLGTVNIAKRSVFYSNIYGQKVETTAIDVNFTEKLLQTYIDIYIGE